MNRLFAVSLLACAAVFVALGIPVVSYRMRPKIMETKAAVTLEKQIGRREVMEKNDCAKIAAVRTYEDGHGDLPWYENQMALEDSRRIVEKKSLFIRKRGELFCRFWTVTISN